MILLIWESWLDKDSWAEHRDPTTAPPKWMFWPISILLVTSWGLAFIFEVDALTHPSVGNLYKAVRCVEFIVAGFYGYFFITILLNYKNEYDGITQCDTTASASSRCGCDDCALTAWLFRKLNNPAPLSSASMNYPPNMEICYSNGYGNMALGEYCKMRQEFPVLFGSFLVVGAALRGLLQMCFFVNTDLVYSASPSSASGVCMRERDELVNSGFTQDAIRSLDSSTTCLTDTDPAPEHPSNSVYVHGVDESYETAVQGNLITDARITDVEAEQLLCAFREDSGHAREHD